MGGNKISNAEVVDSTPASGILFLPPHILLGIIGSLKHNTLMHSVRTFVRIALFSFVSYFS